MHRIIQSALVGALVFLFSNSWLSATEKGVPIPAQIAAAKKVFLANAGNESESFAKRSKESGTDKDRLYNSFYAALRDWGRFELVSTPAQADLIIEIRAVDEITVLRGYSSMQILLSLTLRDPTTRTPLWKFTERPDASPFLNTALKNFDKSVQLLVIDLKDLVTQALAAGSEVTEP